METNIEQGVVAAGSHSTAQAGIDILKRGGNAVDAVIAAAFAVSAGEPTVTSLGGAGMMMLYHRQSGTMKVCDFFANAPRMRPSENANLDFFGIDLDYGPTQQTFFVGRGSAAVPGVIPGLGTIHENYGKLRFEELLEPAIGYLTHGVVLGPRQRAMGDFLQPILTREPLPRVWFSSDGVYLDKDAKFSLEPLANTLRAMQEQGWRAYYTNHLVPQMLRDFGPSVGGLLTAADFEAYRPIFREPIATRFFDHTIHTVPSPAAGGPMIGLMMSLLNRETFANLENTELVKIMAAALETADEDRLQRIAFASDDAELEPLNVEKAFDERLYSLRAVKQVPGGPPSTTHISVIDKDGNAAAVTLSHGESNAYNIGESGIMMNNFLGESDLLPKGFGTATPGERLSTMMSPTIALGSRNSTIALGTGGANRIRSAIVQTLWQLIARRESPIDSINAPRMHYENGELNIETFAQNFDLGLLNASIPNGITEFKEQNLYFGGVNCAIRRDDQSLDGAGDPRRGGVCLKL